MIRAESEADHEGVYAVHAAAFPGPEEANLVNTLRSQVSPLVSLVAETDGEILGHILFSPVTLSSHPGLCIMGLAPMAVLPRLQNQGVGSKLVEAGLVRCREIGAVAVVVLGHPEYYPRFGFQPSTRFGIDSEYEVPEEVFMAMELQPGALGDRAGRVQYHAAFAEV